jgi:hypothetical protein
MSHASEITFILTSCGRFDLLAATLSSFLAFNTAPMARYLVIEDSGNASVRDVLAAFDGRFELILNDPPLGQIKSIDLAYAQITTPYIFHCEDDWRFFRSGFVEESLLLLEQVPQVSTVLSRRQGENRVHDRLLREAGVRRLADVEYRQPGADADAKWGGYSFNPGLRRLADFHRLGSFSALGHEIEASQWFKRMGMGIAVLERPACETSGRGRRVHGSFSPRKRRGLLGWVRRRLGRRNT